MNRLACKVIVGVQP